jgi:hypothetical protein
MPPRRRDSNPRWLLALAACSVAMPVGAAAQWLPVTAEELQMTDEPRAPKAPAILLYRQVDRDDNAPSERDYFRIKILTEEGRQYGNVEIVFDNNRETIHDIEARVIRPDGAIVNFDGTVYDKQIAEGHGLKLRAKAFALPDVEVGSIIEYRYTQQLTYGTVFNSQWILSETLFTKDAKFSLLPHRRFLLRYSWPLGLPQGTSIPTGTGGVIRLAAHDVPAFVKEDHEPPDSELKYRVDLIYVPHGDEETDPTRFWKKFGKARFISVDDFLDQRRVMGKAVAQIVAPDDSPEVKLRKLYARVQELHNLSFGPNKSEQEKDREHQRDAKDVADVWQRGYGTGPQITWLFLGLARAAGFQADPVLVSNRDEFFFDPQVMNTAQLNTNVALVAVGGKELYLDPGAAFTPFGLLPWGKTGVRGLRLDKDGGQWIETPLPAPSISRIEHKADLRLTPSGALMGRVTITYTGLEARACRLQERNEDATHRNQYLENLLKTDVPSEIDAALVNTPDWGSSESPFVAEYDVAIPDWATVTAQRALMAVGLFTGRFKHLFEHAVRVHPVYFSFPFESVDDVRIALPAAWQVTSLPKAHDTNIGILAYQSAVINVDGTLQLKRDLISSVTLVDAQYYDWLRDFFQSMRTGDSEQLILSAGAPPALR